MCDRNDGCFRRDTQILPGRSRSNSGAVASSQTIWRRNLSPSVQTLDLVKCAIVLIDYEYGVIFDWPASPVVHNLLHPTVEYFLVSVAVCPQKFGKCRTIGTFEFRLGDHRHPDGDSRVSAPSASCQLNPIPEFVALRVVDDRVVDPDPHTPASQAPSVRIMRPNLLKNIRLMCRKARRAQEASRFRMNIGWRGWTAEVAAARGDWRGRG